ncbi:hypothetical protein TPL01_02350 [Sulfuriferula plumbiphila]|uniref:Uncharacterized protein n=1 Tax=Sulfuriferula plumbiphila TaxID=171865 RepID=A0A512L3Q0_9PROT|nr:hypothetical protein [Sulfuriferula plumbiphila]BBP02803.1 hypothetical protein SFPGR_02250 [Sulfuriferula plumbiphila]GEP29097.1 hypothetical protein TPL01_02350 [Sulfuriferula plumbiphila]
MPARPRSAPEPARRRQASCFTFKPAPTRDTPSGILNSAAGNPGFPHQRSAGRRFHESPLESYRKLGHYFAARVFDDACREMPGNDYNTEKRPSPAQPGRAVSNSAGTR